MLYEVAESLINSIVEGPDYEHAEAQEKTTTRRELNSPGSELEFEQKRADLSKDTYDVTSLYIT